MLPYQDPALTVEERTEDLLSRMTVKEKIGQLKMKLPGWHCYKKTGEGEYELTQTLFDEVEICGGMGGLYGLFRADPWSGANYETGIPFRYAAKVGNAIQKYVLEHSRLGIPVLFADECPHGLQGLDGVVYPENLSAACSFNDALRKENFRHIAAELRARGTHVGLAATLDILQDGRWGRSEECYGEDPCLAARMTGAVTRGLQGDSISELKNPDRIAVQLKHFAGQGAALGGHNGSAANIGERELREIHIPAMEAGARAGAQSVMAAYPSIDGVFCHSNHRLLTEILRDELGFDGFVISDGEGVDSITVQTAGDHKKAGVLALNAGVDMALWGDCYDRLAESLTEGSVSMETVDEAVRRILKVKFRLGLFENPYTDEEKWKTVDIAAARESSLNMARESITLLENDGILPIATKGKRIAVIGPNADCLYNQLGDYVAEQKRENGVTVLDGIRALAKDAASIEYVHGCFIRDLSRDTFDAAVEAAKRADIVILVLGSSSTRDFGTVVDSHGAVVVGDGSEMDCGEGVDKADLCLGGLQEELAKAITDTGVPTVTVLIEGRPHTVEALRGRCRAILSGWYPGINGGTAVAEVLFGKVNPSGRLAVSIPESSAQLPAYYNRYPHFPYDYVDKKDAPRYPFGYGLSYTKFGLSDLTVGAPLTVKELAEGKTIPVSVKLRNTGDREGKEVVQLYIHDEDASVLRRVKELKDFRKVSLLPGEEKTVTLSLGFRELSLVGLDWKRVVEPGYFKVFVSIGDGETLTDMAEVL